MGIESWSTTAASNNAAPPNGFPEGQLPSSLNDCNRQVMASVRSQCESAEWFNWGDTPAQASASTFTVATDLTSRFTKGRRIKCNDGSVLYGTITASAYSAPNTTVTVGLDSGSLTSSLSSIALAILSPTNLSIPVNLGIKGATLASASTVDLSAASGDFVDISGTTTITAFGTAGNGVARHVRFTGALTLTHNSTSLILPGSANITTANGDTAIFRSLGSGNWQCMVYQKKDGTALVAPASNPFSDSSGLVKNNSDNTKIWKVDASGITTGTTRTWTVPDMDVSNFLVQRVSTMFSALVTGTTTIPYDDTIPQNTEGVQFMTQAITPKNANNVLVITAVLTQTSSNVTNFNQMQAALFQDSTANAIAAVGYAINVDRGNHLIIRHVMTAGTTSSTTFKVRGGSDGGGTTCFNGANSARRYGGVFASSMTIEEYIA
jgi:hypothetical protein